MPFVLAVALRFLREGRLQTALIIGGVTVGVAVMVFLSALISGLQQDLIAKTLGTQAHISVQPPDEEPRGLIDRSQAAVFDRVQQPAQRLRSILSWPRILASVRNTPGVRAASPTINGPGLAQRANASASVMIRGIEPPSYDSIVSVSRRMTAGSYSVQGEKALIGTELAARLGLGLGDKLRLEAGGERVGVFTVGGIFDLQNLEVNKRWVLLSLPAAQTLLDLTGGISAIEVTVDDVFGADVVAARLASETRLTAESWMTRNRQLLVALRSQSSSSGMIQFFVVLAVALGIASVLFVSVVQKSREVGILKAMGAQTATVTGVFVTQGLLVGVVGSLLGCALGALLGVGFVVGATGPNGAPPFSLDLSVALFVRAAIVAILAGALASLAPALRAARLDPATVIRYG